MDEIVFQIERDDSGILVAAWDAPGGGGITTQGRDLSELQEQVKDAVRCHFEDGSTRLAFAWTHKHKEAAGKTDRPTLTT